MRGEDQLRHPVGLVYSETSPGSNQPAEFIGSWYNLAVQTVCDFYGMPGPCRPTLTKTPKTWACRWAGTSYGLCAAGWGTVDAFDWELGPGTEATCYGPPYNGDVWFFTYGWMMHLYNFIPNPDGRFMLWNTNPDFP